MNPQIQANKRLVYLNTLASARELHQFIQYLDQKYGVDSTDPDNTFGRIFLDQPIIKHGVANTLYFAGISNYRPDDLRLPKYQAIPHTNTVLLIDKKQHVSLATSLDHIKAKRVPITVEEADIERLKELREAFKTEVTVNKPLEPDLSDTNRHQFVDKNGIQIPFHKLPQHHKNTIYDRLLTEQRFATHKDHYLKKSIMVPDVNGKYDTFTVEFSRLGSNKTPHFSTTYRGWQNQEEMDHNDPVYAFYKKWDVFHGNHMTIEEWTEMVSDVNEIIQTENGDDYGKQ